MCCFGAEICPNLRMKLFKKFSTAKMVIGKKAGEKPKEHTVIP
jgi:hypothetical protein